MSTMRAQLVAAALAHPRYPEFAYLLTQGWPADRCADLVGDAGRPLLFTDHGTQWRVRNNPARLTVLAESKVSTCPGFTGRKTPRPSLLARGRLFKHLEHGFSLFLDDHLAYGNVSASRDSRGYFRPSATGCDLRLGGVTLRCRLRAGATQGTITGEVPASWLVDLNAGGILPDPEPELSDSDLWTCAEVAP